MKKKPIKDKEFEERFEKRRKRARKKERLNVFLLLLLPRVLAGLLLLAAVYAYGLSLILLYRILPLFYTAEKRIRCLVSGIGNPKFSYADGYKAFFKNNKGGVFGAISARISALCVGFLSYLLAYAVRNSLINVFPTASRAYQAIKEAIAEGDRQNLTMVFVQNRGYLAQPLSIASAIVFFLPIFRFFFSVDNSLSNHYLAGVVLPDIDNNVSAAQARNLAKGSFGYFTTSFRRKQYFSKNWFYFVIYALIYSLSAYGVSNIQVSDANLVPLVVRITPIVGLCTFLILNVFILVNCYAVIEESQERILNSIPATRKVSIYQTYCNPNYIHGEESAIRGCFIPADQGTGAGEFYSPFGPSAAYNPEEKPKDEPIKPKEEAPADEQPSGFVFDFTKDKKDSDSDPK